MSTPATGPATGPAPATAPATGTPIDFTGIEKNPTEFGLSATGFPKFKEHMLAKLGDKKIDDYTAFINNAKIHDGKDFDKKTFEVFVTPGLESAKDDNGNLVVTGKVDNELSTKWYRSLYPKKTGGKRTRRNKKSRKTSSNKKSKKPRKTCRGRK
jgi:hypothetical protein